MFVPELVSMERLYATEQLHPEDFGELVQHLNKIFLFRVTLSYM